MKIISFVLPCLLVLAGCSTPSQPVSYTHLTLPTNS
ncbi:hypothetical protein ACX3VG_30600, partial [Escherichia coli]